MIEVNIWKDWILTHEVLKFGWIKLDNYGDMAMCSQVIIYNSPKFFIKYVYVCMFVCVHAYVWHCVSWCWGRRALDGYELFRLNIDDTAFILD